jgi:hypothetical protein
MSRQTPVNNRNHPPLSTLAVKNIFTVDLGLVGERRSHTQAASIVRHRDVLQGSRKSGLASPRVAWLAHPVCRKSARIAEQ